MLLSLYSKPPIKQRIVTRSTSHSHSTPITIKGNDSLKINGNIYYRGTQPISVKGNSSISTGQYIVAPYATVSFKGGGNIENFNGTILAESLHAKGNVTLSAGSSSFPLPNIPTKLPFDNTPKKTCAPGTHTIHYNS